MEDMEVIECAKLGEFEIHLFVYKNSYWVRMYFGLNDYKLFKFDDEKSAEEFYKSKFPFD